MAKKKVCAIRFDERRKMIESKHPDIAIYRQCELVGISRTAYYYEPVEDIYNYQLMRLIDKQFLKTPFYGIKRMTAWIKREGHNVNEKRVRRLMRLMDLNAVYPKPRLSFNSNEHKVYPYLLSNIAIIRSNQVWSADITYIRLKQGFIYLVAIMDWYSRYVLSWEVSTTLDKEFCLVALKKALKTSKSEIFNTDQGVQFTCSEFTGLLKDSGIKISMDGRGRVFDNIFIERLWRSVKYEEVYLNEYEIVKDAKNGFTRYFQFYNNERPHQSLDDLTPDEVYCNDGLKFKKRQAA